MAWRGPTVKPAGNQPPNPVNHGPEMAESKKSVPSAVFGPLAVPNRAYNVRRDKDDQKDFSVTLIDVDTTILSYLDNVISPTIIDAGRQVKVPINYASPERWKAIRKDGGIRDKNGKIQCPAMAMRRTTMQRNDNLVTLNRYLQYPVVKQFSEKNKYDKFSVMTGFNPRKELYSVAMPDHVIVNYDFIIWTDLVEQGNTIVEAVNFATEDYWGDKLRLKFRTTISDYNFETSTDADQDRIVKTTFNMMVYAYLLPDRYENYKSTVQKAFTPRKIVFDTEVAGDNQAELDELRKQMKEKISTGNYPDIIQYVEHANIADVANSAISASYATSASFISILGSEPTTLNSLNIIGGGATGKFGTNIVTGLDTFGPVDTFPIETCNSAMWLVSTGDGTNFKTNEVVANWDSGSVNFYNTEVSQIGTVPVMLSVNNTGGNINLLANPLSGTWTIKMIRMII